MSTATINVRIDQKTKREITDFADQLGMPVSVLIVATIKQMLRTGHVEFGVDPEPNENLKKAIREAEEDELAGRVTYVNTTDEAMEHLDSLKK